MPAPPPARAWTITLTTTAGRSTLACSACSSVEATPGVPVDRQVHRHLVRHLTTTPLPPHLRICQCREHGCTWHRLQAPCSGPLRLLLARADASRTWRLADTCHGCAHATPHSATVPEPTPHTTSSPHSAFDTTTPDLTDEPAEWVEAL